MAGAARTVLERAALIIFRSAFFKAAAVCVLAAAMQATPRAVTPPAFHVAPVNRCTDGRPCEDLKPGWPLAYRFAIVDAAGAPIAGARARVTDGLTGFSSDVSLVQGIGLYQTRVPDFIHAGAFTMTFDAIHPDGTIARVVRTVRVTRPDSRCGSATPEPDSTSFEFPIGSGHRWFVKRTDYPMGPRANNWSDSPENVWLDELGQLHLRMTERDGIWYSAEVCSEESFGYGDYIFFLGSRIEALDRAVVGALFTYETDDREIDIEFSQWGCSNAPNTQYGIQPFGTMDEDTCQVYPFTRRGHRFQTFSPGIFTTHRFSWRKDGVSFASDHGHVMAARGSLSSWSYTGTVPPASRERVHMSLWWAKNTTPVMEPAGPQELVITAVLLPPDIRALSKR